MDQKKERKGKEENQRRSKNLKIVQDAKKEEQNNQNQTGKGNKSGRIEQLKKPTANQTVRQLE